MEWYNKVILGQNLETAAIQGSSWIDARDLAIAHMKAIEKEEAGGERIIVAQGERRPFIRILADSPLLRPVYLAELG